LQKEVWKGRTNFEKNVLISTTWCNGTPNVGTHFNGYFRIYKSSAKFCVNNFFYSFVISSSMRP
jgi:hypothetical protein